MYGFCVSYYYFTIVIEWLPAAILSIYKQGTIQVTYYCRAIIILLLSLSQSPGNNNNIALLVSKPMEHTILSWPSKALHNMLYC